MRYLALDLGQKRTGVACGDDLTGIVTPMRTIETNNAEHRLRSIGQLLDNQIEADALVVGLPLNMDGSRGQAAKQAESFAQSLRERFALAVHLVDERQSSEAANQRLAQSGFTHGQKKARRDALAAVEILERFFRDA